MESMTGYAFLEKSTDQFSYSVELKSLNTRYLETYVNVPKVLRNEENELLNLIKKSFARGKIELSIDIFDWVETRPVSLNAELIKKYYRELKLIHSGLKIAEPLEFESVLALDGITHRERSSISDKSKGDIYRTISQIIKKALEMRKQEGMSIKKDLAYSISEISGHIRSVDKIAPRVAGDKKEALKTRLKALAGAEIDDVRLYSEIAILADKMDINEEIIRLKDHIKKFKSIMTRDEQAGKKLDFLSQEMFREVNTIGSKSNSSEISHIVVELKNHIERIREHCRNIV